MSDLASQRIDLRWWQYIGPWPIRPLMVTVFAMSFFAFTAAASAIIETELVANVSFASNALSIVGGGAAVWLMLEIARRVARRHPLTLTTYLLVFLVTTVVAVIIRTYVGQISDLLFVSPGAFVSTVLRVAIPLVVVNSIVGVATARLAAQVEQTQAALALTRLQQDWMLEADEQARRQVADTLHDQVQAALIAACLQLQAIGPDDRAGIDAVIHRLEELRKVDVRRAARALSPTLSEVGLGSSLAELASQYEPGMVALISVSTAADGSQGGVDERTRLGCYRIVEQALLNSAGHGRARICEVYVDVEGHDGDRAVVLTIDDDGQGFIGGVPEPGSGSALISTWVRTLRGEWLWTERPEGGVRVRVRLPASQM